jgi:peptide/nickel transport system substrate-binding protein
VKTMISRRQLVVRSLALLATTALVRPARAEAPAPAGEPPFLEPLIADGKLPPLSERLPKSPLVTNMIERGRTLGQYGGDMRTLVAKARDLRYITVCGYTRLVGYDEHLNLEPDILEMVDNDSDRVITFTLREGHRWSDGEPFTTEDFRFWWEDIARNLDLRPAGPPAFMIVDGEPPKVEIIDATHIRYSWSKPNPRFLPSLAGPRPDWIYSPAHYLKHYHKKYADPVKLTKMAKDRQMASWATNFNKLDDPYEASNPEQPTLDPWRIMTKAPAQQFIFERNAFFHRVDPQGRQLPYIDRIIANVASAGLFATKANAGEVDLLFRGITTGDIPMLKEGEASHNYRTLAWPIARGSAFALYPDLTCNDPVWRGLLRDVRVRRALSLGIDRHTLNNALWFRLGIEGNNTVLPSSALYNEDDQKTWASYDPGLANQLLDEVGLIKKDPTGIRFLPDGRIAELIVEVAGEASDIIDALQITSEFWQEIGIKMVIKPEDPSDLNQRAFAGQTVMVAAQGLDNAIPTAVMSPTELAPLRQDNMAWPKWGQYVETAGASGEKVDMPQAQLLLDFYKQWMDGATLKEKTQAWRRMLSLHADQQFIIGTVQGALQPIIAAKSLQNIPKKAIFSWEPTALLGVYRIDEFYHDQKTAQAETAP